MKKQKLIISLGFLISASFIAISAAPILPTNPEVDCIFQYFVQSEISKDRPGLGAYLWIPPNTPKIRAVMVGMHNGLPINILQSPQMRAVCRKYGIAQILMTPWAKDIGSIMLKDLNYDVTDSERTAIYDGYMQKLADLSDHPELITAPIVPLAHSAFCDFPFDAAIRKPEQCLAAIPIKAGLPDVYKFFAADGKAKVPDPTMALRNVPILFVTSASQETVSWSEYPHAFGGSGIGSYRRDRNDNPGTTYETRNELFGICWDMMSGHFDMMPRNYQFVADWLEAIAAARLPQKVGSPLINLNLRDGWLIGSKIPAKGDLSKDYAMPAPYLEFKGQRNQALWFPNEKLARTVFELGFDEPRKKIEMFTFLDPEGKPISIAHNVGASLTNVQAQAMIHDDGLLTLTTYRFMAPPEICTVKDKEHLKKTDDPHSYANVLFPGQTTMPVSDIPLLYHAHGGVLELVKSEQIKDERGVTETRLTLRLKRHRIATGSGFNMSFVRIFHEGNKEFSAAGRTCQIQLSPSDVPFIKNATKQTIDFPTLSDKQANTSNIQLNAKSSAGLPVDYFVVKGPGFIQNGMFVPSEIPVGLTKPIEVTIGAYQVGLFKEIGGVKPSETVYQTFQLIPNAK